MFIQLSYEELKNQGVITGKEQSTKEIEKNVAIFFSKLWDTPDLMFHRIYVCKNMSGEITRIEFNIPFNFFEKNKDINDGRKSNEETQIE